MYLTLIKIIRKKKTNEKNSEINLVEAESESSEDSDICIVSKICYGQCLAIVLKY